MVPFEPKTNSKEFEISNSEQGLSTGSRSAAYEAADLTIRIWHQDSSGGRAALTWNSESVLVYMIADLVTASHGRTAVETPPAIRKASNWPIGAISIVSNSVKQGA